MSSREGTRTQDLVPSAQTKEQPRCGNVLTSSTCRRAPQAPPARADPRPRQGDDHARLEALLVQAGDLIDVVKIGWGIGYVDPTLKERVALCHSAGIVVSPRRDAARGGRGPGPAGRAAPLGRAPGARRRGGLQRIAADDPGGEDRPGAGAGRATSSCWPRWAPRRGDVPVVAAHGWPRWRPTWPPAPAGSSQRAGRAAPSGCTTPTAPCGRTWWTSLPPGWAWSRSSSRRPGSLSRPGSSADLGPDVNLGNIAPDEVLAAGDAAPRAAGRHRRRDRPAVIADLAPNTIARPYRGLSVQEVDVPLTERS